MTWIHCSQRSFSESFFHVLNWWYFLSQRMPQCNPKKPFSGHSKTVLMDCSTKHKWIFVIRIHTSQRRLSVSVFLVFNWWYFLYHPRPQCDPKEPFSDSWKTVLMACSMKHKCNSVRWIYTSPRGFYESFFLVFFWGYFLCHRELHCTKRYPFADFKETVIANSSLKRNL